MEGPISVPISAASVSMRTKVATGDAHGGARRGRKRSNNNTSGYIMYAKKIARRNTNRVRRIMYTPYKIAATITTVNVIRAALASHTIIRVFSLTKCQMLAQQEMSPLAPRSQQQLDSRRTSSTKLPIAVRQGPQFRAESWSAL